MEAPVVTVTQLTHLYINRVDVLDVLSAPLLSSLTIGRIPARPQSQKSITRFPPSIEMSSREFEHQ